MISFDDFRTVKGLRTGDRRDTISPEMALAAAISREAHVITTVQDDISTNELVVLVEVYGVKFWTGHYARILLLDMPEEYLRHEVNVECEKAYHLFLSWFDWTTYWEVPNEGVHAVEV